MKRLAAAISLAVAMSAAVTAPAFATSPNPPQPPKVSGLPAHTAGSTVPQSPPAPVYVGTVYLAAPTQNTATDPTGICWSSTNWCWRVNGAAIDLWARAIAQDPYQQFAVYYNGTAVQLGCRYPIGSAFGPNVGTYSFLDHNGKWVSAGYFDGSVYWVGEQSSFNNASLWEWGTTGVMSNCGDNNQHPPSAWYLQSAGQLYTQLWVSTNSTAPQWQQVHV